MLKLMSLLGAAAVLAAFSAPARADTILDFTQGGTADLVGQNVTNKADNGTSVSDWWQTGGTGVAFNVLGVAFTGTAWKRDSTTDTTRDQIFLYGDTNPDKGGLGAVLGGHSYAGSPEDNVWDYQSVQLAFTGVTHLGQSTFYNGDHGTTFGTSSALAEIWISVDGGAWIKKTLTTSMNLDLWGTTFEFFNPNASGHTSDNFRFYVSTLATSPVPEPASLALFGVGAAGFAALRRRRQRRQPTA